jgi:hypothetical protein
VNQVAGRIDVLDRVEQRSLPAGEQRDDQEETGRKPQHLGQSYPAFITRSCQRWNIAPVKAGALVLWQDY